MIVPHEDRGTVASDPFPEVDGDAAGACAGDGPGAAGRCTAVARSSQIGGNEHVGRHLGISPRCGCGRRGSPGRSGGTALQPVRSASPKGDSSSMAWGESVEGMRIAFTALRAGIPRPDPGQPGG